MREVKPMLLESKSENIRLLKGRLYITDLLHSPRNVYLESDLIYYAVLFEIFAFAKYLRSRMIRIFSLPYVHVCVPPVIFSTYSYLQKLQLVAQVGKKLR